MSLFQEMLLEKRIIEAAKRNEIVLSKGDLAKDNFEEILRERLNRCRQARKEMGLQTKYELIGFKRNNNNTKAKAGENHL